MVDSAGPYSSYAAPDLRTIIIDLGGVCFTNGTRRAIDRLAATYRLHREDVAAVLSGPLGSEYRMGRIGSEDFWAKARTAWGVRAGSDRLNKVWHGCYRRIQGTFSLLDRLLDAGHELLYLSDNVPERIEYLETKYRFLRFFADGVLSYQVHLGKPDPQIYQRVLAKASRPAAQCVYIDDVKELLAPARLSGMATIHFKGARRLEQELRRLGLL